MKYDVRIGDQVDGGVGPLGKDGMDLWNGKGTAVSLRV